MTDEQPAVKKSGYPIHLPRDTDGHLLCPHCHDRMIEIAPEVWQCPIGVAASELMRDAAARLAARLDAGELP